MFGVIYLIVGLVYAYLEHKTFEYKDLDDIPPVLGFIYIGQMSIHLFRCALTWPLHVAEDYLVYLGCQIEENLPKDLTDDEESDTVDDEPPKE
jgi:hypothetical protein